MNCPKCHGNNCIQIEINLKAEDTVEFYSCRLCEHSWWEHGGDTVTLGEVLGLAGRKHGK
jgi:Transcription factor S-II (TFIIS)